MSIPRSIAKVVDAVVSPDGSKIAYVVERADRDQDRTLSTVWLTNASGTVRRPVVGGGNDTRPVFVSDTELLFVRQVGDQDCILKAAVDALRLTQVPAPTVRSVSRLVVDPDGTRIAYTARLDPPVSPLAPVVADDLSYRSDQRGWLRPEDARHLVVSDLITGDWSSQPVGTRDSSAPSWSDDGGRVAIAAALEADDDLTGRSRLYLADVTRVELGRLHPLPGADAVGGPVAWTPDGAHVLAVGGLEPAVACNKLVAVPVEPGAAAQVVTVDLDRSVMSAGTVPEGGLGRTPDGAAIITVRNGGACELHVAAVNEPARPLPLGGAGEAALTIIGLSTATAAPVAVAVIKSATSAGDVARVDLATGQLHIISNIGDSGLARVGRFDQLHFTVDDGTTVEGWLLRSAKPGPAPTLIDLHGGPHDAWSDAFEDAHIYQYRLHEAGWNVLRLNPRGSDGYGEKFLRATVGDWGGSEVQDVLGPIDQLVADDIADPGRLALTGYSYGGYLSAHLTTLTNRFTSAVVGGLVSDLEALVCTSDERTPLQDLEYDSGNPSAADLRARSPFHNADTVRTPTLILHAGADGNVPLEQADKWFTRLRRQGVTTRMVAYPRATHLMLRNGVPSHREHYARTLHAWVLEHDRTAGVFNETDHERSSILSNLLPPLRAHHEMT